MEQKLQTILPHIWQRWPVVSQKHNFAIGVWTASTGTSSSWRSSTWRSSSWRSTSMRVRFDTGDPWLLPSELDRMTRLRLVGWVRGELGGEVVDWTWLGDLVGWLGTAGWHCWLDWQGWQSWHGWQSWQSWQSWHGWHGWQGCLGWQGWHSLQGWQSWQIWNYESLTGPLAHWQHQLLGYDPDTASYTPYLPEYVIPSVAPSPKRHWALSNRLDRWWFPLLFWMKICMIIFLGWTKFVFSQSQFNSQNDILYLKVERNNWEQISRTLLSWAAESRISPNPTLKETRRRRHLRQLLNLLI